MKLGRNDPCHCERGRKYKHCHYNEDRTAEAQALKEAAEEAVQNTAEAGSGEEGAGTQDAAREAAERAAATGRRDHSGSRFMRNSAAGGGAKSSGKGPALTPRATRGAQRGS